MITVSDALDHILEALKPLAVEDVPLDCAIGRILAEPFVCGWALPHWDNSAMDGFALRAAEVKSESVQLQIVDTVAAGDSGDRPIPPSCTARIFTGAPLPPGTDTVMVQELANLTQSGKTVSFHRAAKPGENVRRRGSDISAGAVGIQKGRSLGVGDINFMASQGSVSACVHKRPRVAILSTGSELCEPGHMPPKRGQIINSNVVAIAAAVRQAGGAPVVTPALPDHPQRILSELRAAMEYDICVVCGGMSVGDYDFVRDALKTVSGDGFAFWKVALKPGKPLGFGCARNCALFGLPGNPASAFVTFELFVKPAIRRLMGQETVRPVIQKARLVNGLKTGGDRQNYLRAAVTKIENGVLWVDTRRNQSSGALSGLVDVDALVIVPASAPCKQSGDWVDIHILGELRPR